MFKLVPTITKTEVNLLTDNTGIFETFECDGSDNKVHETVYYYINMSKELIVPKRLLIYGDIGVYILNTNEVICHRIKDSIYPHGSIIDNVELSEFNEITK